MRKTVFFLALAVTVLFGCKDGEKKEVVSEDVTIETESTAVEMHNSQNSLDWSGVYKGTIPCADCEGIKTVLDLREDNTFLISQSYLGKQPEGQSFDNIGSFSWDDTGSTITLEAQGTTKHYKVGENHVTMLDMKGNIISGDLADFYVLKKQ